MKNKKTKAAAVGAAAVGAIILLTASSCSGDTASSTAQGQATTEQFAQKLTNAEPYPLSQMTDSAERKNDRERLLRMNDPNKVGYFYELSQTGSVIAEYTVKGKVSSTESQLTNSQACVTINYSTSNGCTAVDSMGDDGTYGPEEGGPNGVFFFTSAGVLVEWDGLWQYSDAPLTLTSAPLITMDANAKPSSTAGQLK